MESSDGMDKQKKRSDRSAVRMNNCGVHVVARLHRQEISIASAVIKTEMVLRQQKFLITEWFAVSSVLVLPMLLYISFSDLFLIKSSISYFSLMTCLSTDVTMTWFNTHEIRAVSCRNSSQAPWTESACCSKSCEPFNWVRTPSPAAVRSTHRIWNCATINHISGGLCWMNWLACRH